MNRLDTMHALADAPERIRAAMVNLAAAKDNLSTAERDQKKMRLAFLLLVSGERGDDGKPLYSNEKAREAALDERLSKDPAAVRLIQRVEACEREVQRCTIDLDFEVNQFRAARSIASLVALDKEMDAR